MRLGLPLGAAIVSVGFLTLRPMDQPFRPTGFFSDFAYHAETGDVTGVEIFISHATLEHGLRRQYYAYIQIAEGVPLEPQLVPVTVDGANVRFSLAGRFERLSPFVGTVTADSLVGVFSNGWEIRLPRKGSYWQ
jgi:hypothetical protein